MQTSKPKINIKPLYISIKPAAVAAMVDTGSLVKVLNVLNASFEGIILAELTNRYHDQAAVLKKEIKLLLPETKLLIADFEFSSFTLAIAVDLSPAKNKYRVLTHLPALKEELFGLFRDTVFTADLFSAEYVDSITQQYSPKQRIGIFKSIYDDLINQDDFVFYFGNNKQKVDQRWFKTDDQAILSSLIPEPVKTIKGEVETYYQYVKTGEENDLFGKRAKYKKVLMKENGQHDVYPYQLQKLRVNGKNVVFSRQLTATVSFKNELYQITLPELQISVQDERRENAEKAFDADLAALIIRFEKGNWNSADPKAGALFLKLKEFIAEL